MDNGQVGQWTVGYELDIWTAGQWTVGYELDIWTAGQWTVGNELDIWTVGYELDSLTAHSRTVWLRVGLDTCDTQKTIWRDPKFCIFMIKKSENESNRFKILICL